jgi:hypothetical protein
MIIKNKEVYYCEYCKKHGLAKYKMLYHELICFFNPDNKRPCFNCEFLEKKEKLLYETHHYDGSEYTKKLDLLHCKKKNIFLYTPKNEIKGNMYILEDDENLPMPKECEDYVDSSIFKRIWL